MNLVGTRADLAWTITMSHWCELITHGIAFCAGVAIAAIVFLPYYPEFEERTASASEAFGAFLTFCVIFAGLGPLATLLFFAALRWIKRSCLK
jgi:hypothetical protein